jgi:putative transposase
LFVEVHCECRENWCVDLWAWVIMPEHVHLLVAPRHAGIEVGRFQGAVKEKTSRHAMAWLEENDPAFLAKLTVREGSRVRRRFWQPGGGYDRNINSLATLCEMIEYIHMNPVRRGLVDRPQDWKWSSAAWYAGIRPVPIEMDAILL